MPANSPSLYCVNPARTRASFNRFTSMIIFLFIDSGILSFYPRPPSARKITRHPAPQKYERRPTFWERALF